MTREEMRARVEPYLRNHDASVLGPEVVLMDTSSGARFEGREVVARMLHYNALVTATVVLICAGPARAQEASFEGLGDIPGGARASFAEGVSPDGQTVVGAGTSAVGGEAFIWRVGGGMIGLGDLPGGNVESWATDVSDNGVVVGVGTNAAGDDEPFRWTEAGGMVGLGGFPDADPDGEARGVSADGAVVVGFSDQISARNEAFRWTAGTGMQALGFLSSEAFDSGADDVTADGTVIVGWAEDADRDHGRPVRWVNGVIQLLADLPGGTDEGEAWAVSPDGALAAGFSSGTAGREAALWTEASGVVGLGFLPGGLANTVAYGVSNTGVVVGQGFTPTGPRAFIWTAAEGMRDLKSVLEDDYGLDLAGWTLPMASGISADGTVIVGHAAGPNGNEAFRAVVPAACTSPFGGPGCCSVVTRAWIDPAGGAFADPANWLENQIPGPEEAARFALGSGQYAVQLGGSTMQNAVLVVDLSDVVRLQPGVIGDYTLIGASGCDAALSVRNGLSRLEVDGGTVRAPSVEVTGPGSALVVLPDPGGGAVPTTLFAGSLIVGSPQSFPDRARVEVQSNALLRTSGSAFVPRHEGTHGAMRIEGADGRWIADGDVIIGLGGPGSVEIGVLGALTANRDLNVGSVFEGRLTASTAIVTVGGRLRVGGVGGGTLRLDGGSLLGRPTGPVLLPIPRLIIDGLGVGLVEVVGPATRAAVEQLTIGEGDAGMLRVMNEGRVDVALTQVGAGGTPPTDVGELRVEGMGSLFAGAYMGLGRTSVSPSGAVGILTATPGAVVQLGTLEVGEFGFVNAPAGTLRVQNRIGARAPAARAGGALVEVDSLLVQSDDPTSVVVGEVAFGLGGFLGGAGTFHFDVTNRGVVAPGDTTGTTGVFTVAAGYTQAAEGVLDVELGGTEAGAFDRLDVTGTATLDGTLRVSYNGGFTPAAGDAFTVLTAGSVAGEFATVEAPPGSTFSLAYGPTTVTATVLTVAAEPPAGAQVLALYPPAPNPARDVAAIRYDLPAAGRVRLAVYDALGREVAVLVDGDRPAGAHEAYLGTRALAPGLYVARLRAGERARARTLVVSR